jgi:transcriptional regulator with XRE-family HTH domain
MDTTMNDNFKNISFGERLRDLRIQKKLSQAELGHLVGVQATHIGRYERGESKPSAKYLKLLADSLDVSADYLYDGIEEDAAVADLKDKELVEMFKKLDTLSIEEKDLVKKFIDLVLTKHGVQKLAS